MKFIKNKISVNEKQKVFNDICDKEDHINSLNVYSLAQIFVWLPIPERMVMEEVCSKWKEASELAWFDIKQYKCGNSIGRVYNNKLLTQSYVEKLLLNCGIYLRELFLSRICKSSIMTSISEHCVNLSTLDFVIDEELEIDNNDYIQAFRKLNKLKIIRIAVIFEELEDKKTITKFQYHTLNSLPEELNEIYLLNESYEHKITVDFDLLRFENLHSLSLVGCNLDNIIEKISNKTTLIYLDLENSLVTKYCSYRENYIFSKLINLEYINLFNGCGTITSNSMSNIFNTCKNLSHYDESLTYFEGEMPRILPENWINLKNLKYLSIYWNFTDEIANNILKYCQNLQYINCCFRITKSVLEKLTKLEKLESLILADKELTKEKLFLITNNCKKLKHLKLEYTVFNNGINFWSRREPAFYLDNISNLKYLEYINLLGVNQLRDNCIIAIAKKCKNLKTLNIGFCNITEKALMALAQLETLERLDVRFSKHATDNFICKLKRLNFLSCAGCNKITDVGIIQCINNCPDLKVLDIIDTNITFNTITSADKATKNRQNDIILDMFLNENLVKKYKLEIESDWLNLNSFNSKKTYLRYI